MIDELLKIHTTTGLVALTLQTLNMRMNVKREDEEISKKRTIGLRSARISLHTKFKTSPIKLHFGRDPKQEKRNKLGNIRNALQWLTSTNVQPIQIHATHTVEHSAISK